MMYVPFTTKASEMNALPKVHIHNAVSEPAEWRGMRVTGTVKGLTEEQLSEIADHELIETIDYTSSSLTDTEAYIDLYTSDHFQTNRALAVALPAWCKTDNVTLSSIPHQSTAKQAHMAKTPMVSAKEANAAFERKNSTQHASQGYDPPQRMCLCRMGSGVHLFKQHVPGNLDKLV
eukprot:16608-Ditylum_brightwellii.AAC.1